MLNLAATMETAENVNIVGTACFVAVIFVYIAPCIE